MPDFRAISRALVDQEIFAGKVVLSGIEEYLNSIPDTKVEVVVEEDFVGAFRTLRLASRELDEIQTGETASADRLSGKLLLQGAARYLLTLQDREVAPFEQSS